MRGEIFLSAAFGGKKIPILYPDFAKFSAATEKISLPNILSLPIAEVGTYMHIASVVQLLLQLLLQIPQTTW